MKTELKFGMLHTVYTGEAIIEEVEVTVLNEDGEEETVIEQIEKHGHAICVDPKCGRMVKHNEHCFIDVLSANGDLYCDSCGKCIRYARKKAEQRKQKKAAAQNSPITST